MEKLYELTEGGDYDVVVVDTPPTRNALDLLDAPRRLTHFLENRIFRALLVPTRAYLRALAVASQALLRTISKVAGAEIVQDAVAFFQAFQGMEQGFHDRAAGRPALLADPSTAYVVVTSPRPDAVEEAAYFAARLAATGVSPAALVVNRVHPRFGRHRRPGCRPRPAATWPHWSTTSSASTPWPTREQAAYAELVRQVAPSPVGRVPLLGGDVHDLDGLGTVADHLFAGERRRAQRLGRRPGVG